MPLPASGRRKRVARIARTPESFELYGPVRDKVRRGPKHKDCDKSCDRLLVIIRRKNVARTNRGRRQEREPRGRRQEQEARAINGRFETTAPKMKNEKSKMANGKCLVVAASWGCASACRLLLPSDPPV